tara:strand:- start:2389 stop:2637 length:249 start_codon:yes stop_codon:yes gene_type:complete
MQGGHQSDPVNFTRIHFFSAVAFFFPASKSVRKSPACAVAVKATEKMARIIVFSAHDSIRHFNVRFYSKFVEIFFEAAILGM